MARSVFSSFAELHSYYWWFSNADRRTPTGSSTRFRMYIERNSRVSTRAPCRWPMRSSVLWRISWQRFCRYFYSGNCICLCEKSSGLVRCLESGSCENKALIIRTSFLVPCYVFIFIFISLLSYSHGKRLAEILPCDLPQHLHDRHCSIGVGTRDFLQNVRRDL